MAVAPLTEPVNPVRAKPRRTRSNPARPIAPLVPLDAMPDETPPETECEVDTLVTPYASSMEHLRDELGRVDLLVRAYTEIWQQTLALHKTYETVGVPHVSSGEVAAYLQQPFTLEPPLSPETEERVAALVALSAGHGRAIARRRALTSPAVTLRLARLQERCGLSDLERDLLLVCLLPELDARYRRLFGYLLDDASRTQPTVELLLGIAWPAAGAPSEKRAAFEASRRLLAQDLIVLGGESRGDASLAMRSVRLDDRIAAYLLGRDEPDDRLTGVLSPAVEPARWEEVVAGPEHRERLQALAGWWAERARQPRTGTTLLFHGPPGSGRRLAARAICTAAATPLLIVDVAAALRAATPWDQIVALSYREARLGAAAICWSGCEAILDDPARSGEQETLLAAAEAYRGLTVLTTRSAWDPAGRFRERPFVSVAFPMPGYELRRALWAALLPPDPAFPDWCAGQTPLASALANGFQLTAGQMRDALATARWQATTRDPASPTLRRADLYEGCRRQSSRRLMAFATRIERRADLDMAQLILPPANKRHLEELQARLRHQGRVRASFERRLPLGQGCVVLFTGGSGTGKTMAAELLAQNQGVDLYKVDLSAVVSKWVGETEKNLSRVFAEAADANAILFFDEADALFGQRGQVKDPQDRWANMEVNYLLQRIEEYAGVVVLASNLRQNIDEAFMRRVQVAVNFPFPEAWARLAIVRGLLPPSVHAPGAADLAALTTRFKLAGGSWKNVVVDATFRAVAEASNGRTAMTTQHLVLAIGREYQKLGKPLTRGEFGEPYFGWIEQGIL